MVNKAIIGILVALLVVTGAVIVFSGNDESEEESQNQIETSQREDTNETEASSSETEAMEQATANGLGYVDYSEETLVAATGSKRVVFFHAPWCSVCNFYEGQIEEQGVPTDVTILKVDFDSEEELKEQYDVNVQSTFVLLDENGNVVESWPFARGLNGIQDLYDAII